MNAASSSNVDQLTILNGGVEIDVTRIDGSKERAKVRQLPLRLIPQWTQELMNEPKLVELYVERDQAWVDSIIIEDQERILELGGQLNYPIFDRWTARLQATTGRALQLAENRAAATETIKARAQALGMPVPTSP